MSKTWVSRGVLALLAAVGITVAHWAAYLAAASGAHAHHDLLQSTGHRYWPFAGALIVALIVGTLGFSACRPARLASGRLSGFVSSVVILAAIQTLGFVLLEFGERALFASHHGPSSLASEPVFWIGLVLQLFVAVAGALVVHLLLKVVAIVRALLAGTYVSARSTSFSLSSQYRVPSLTVLSGGSSLRGPPLSASI
jgi:hypothetical protein